MADIRFSIVIPTRNRADTLFYAIESCLAQQFDNFEVIVCDNCSSAATKEVVGRFKSVKIKYVRSDRPLAMCDSWELAVEHASGEYVIVIGDDDGLLLHSLYEIDRLLTLLRLKALRWDRVYYSWPNIPLVEVANKLDIPFGDKIQILRAKDVIQRVANFEIDYTMLPMLYNSAIHHGIISSLRKRAGRVFGGPVPDIYSGFAFAYLIENYVSVEVPMSINAGSAKSNGVAGMLPSSKIAEEFYSLNKKANVASCNPRVPDLPLVTSCIADSFLRAKNDLFPNDSNLDINRKVLVSNCVQALESSNHANNELEWTGKIQTIRKSLTDDKRLQVWFDSEFMVHHPFVERPYKNLEWKKGFYGKKLHIDAAEFGVADVFGVAELCEKILGYKETGLERLIPEPRRWFDFLRMLKSKARKRLLANPTLNKIVRFIFFGRERD